MFSLIFRPHSSAHPLLSVPHSVLSVFSVVKMSPLCPLLRFRVFRVFRGQSSPAIFILRYACTFQNPWDNIPVRTEGAVPDGSTPRCCQFAFQPERGISPLRRHGVFGVAHEVFGLLPRFCPNLPRTEPPCRRDSQNNPNTNRACHHAAVPLETRTKPVHLAGQAHFEKRQNPGALQNGAKLLGRILPLYSVVLENQTRREFSRAEIASPSPPQHFVGERWLQILTLGAPGESHAKALQHNAFLHSFAVHSLA
jgi:hypothetical protein